MRAVFIGFFPVSTPSRQPTFWGFSATGRWELMWSRWRADRLPPRHSQDLLEEPNFEPFIHTIYPSRLFISFEFFKTNQLPHFIETNNATLWHKDLFAGNIGLFLGEPLCPTNLGESWNRRWILGGAMTTLVRRLPWCHLLVVMHDNKLTQPMANWLTFKLFGDLYICIHLRICIYIFGRKV